jgi:hypothetical protein
VKHLPLGAREPLKGLQIFTMNNIIK